MWQFFWGQKDTGTKVVLLSWAKLGTSKIQGGMGFRDLECFNMTMLAKQGWCLFTNQDSLVARILKEKYYPQQFSRGSSKKKAVIRMEKYLQFPSHSLKKG